MSHCLSMSDGRGSYNNFRYVVIDKLIVLLKQRSLTPFSSTNPFYGTKESSKSIFISNKSPMLTILRNKRKRVKSFRFPDLYDVQECVSMLLANSFTMSFTCNTLVCNCFKIWNAKRTNYTIWFPIKSMVNLSSTYLSKSLAS